MKEVLITGGAGGIGKEIVKAMLARGFFVHVIDTDIPACERLVAMHGDAIKTYNVDVTDAGALRSLAQELSGKASFEHIITLAGRAIPDEWAGFSEAPSSAIEKSVSLNLSSHLQTVHAFLPLMDREGDRSVLMISSINAITSYGIPIYSSAKAGLVGFVNSAVVELGERGIRINAILPGTVVTEATLGEPKDFEALKRTTALGRFVPAEEVAACAAAISCDFHSMTGQTVVLDAGQSKKHML